jgi:signal transduction histidine kinase
MVSFLQLGQTHGVRDDDFDPFGAEQPSPTAELLQLRAEVERLKEAIHLRDQRTAFVMHELRQPLSVLLLASASLARRSSDRERCELERLYAGGLRLDSLVSDLNDASFLESGTFALNVTRTDLIALIGAAVDRHEPCPEVSVEGEIPLMDLDAHRIDQILTNLLVNAQKYGSSHSVPRVDVVRTDGVVVVSVTNDGGDISDDERTKVFEPYYRGRDRKPGTRGLGLGLYVCRRLVEEHGGRIWTDGDASQTRFSFSVPVPEQAARPSGIRFVGTEPV